MPRDLCKEIWAERALIEILYRDLARRPLIEILYRDLVKRAAILLRDLLYSYRELEQRPYFEVPDRDLVWKFSSREISSSVLPRDLL